MKYFEIKIYLREPDGNRYNSDEIYSQRIEVSAPNHAKIQKIAAVVNDLPFPIEFPIGVSADQ